MLLGLSSNPDNTDPDNTKGDEIDPGRLAHGAGVADGMLLIDFVNALSAGENLSEQRDLVTSAIGREAMVDAVAVFANFSMMTRIADGTGTPLDAGSTEMSAGLRSDLGINDWTTTRLNN